MKKLYIIILLNILLFGKEHYYSFIDLDGKLISEEEKQKVFNGFKTLENIRVLVQEDKIEEAYTQIKELKDKNKLPIIETDLILLYAEILYKTEQKRNIQEADKTLEEAINNSKIYEEELYKAYLLLVDININLNRVNQATDYANTVINNFSDPLIRAYGKIALAKVYAFSQSYESAEKTLYEVLVETSDVNVATVVANELFDIYLMNDKKDKAYELMQKILDKNVDFYLKNPYDALKKVETLSKANMPQFAVNILKELVNNAKTPENKERFQYELADIYMQMYDKTPTYLNLASELYKNIINDYPNGKYSQKAKMYLDEVLMRKNQISPSVVYSRYKDVAGMQQKVLLQELLDYKQSGQYEMILKSKKVYKKISDSIAKRFGYESLQDVIDEVNMLLVEKYINENRCDELDKALEDITNEALNKVIESQSLRDKYFECLVEKPNLSAYESSKDAFNSSRDGGIYHNLERAAFALEKYDDAKSFANKIDMLNDDETNKKEFLDRLKTYLALNDMYEMDRFFAYAKKHPEYIIANENKPGILDFYYQYYSYLKKTNDLNLANDILNKLYNKQKQFNAKIYSPFVEIELANNESKNKNYQKSIDYLMEAKESGRKVSNEDLAKIYYEASKVYTQMKNEEMSKNMIGECKKLQNIQDNFYKKLCDRL